MAKFQSFWFGDKLPPHQQLAMKSFVDHGHEYVLYAYTALDVPPGVALRDASEILPQSRVFFYGERAGLGRGSVAAFANLFRYHLLHQKGDWWVDTDVVCLTDKVPATPIFMGWEYEDLIGNAILKFPNQHEFVRQLRDAADSAGSDLSWGTTGPNLLTTLVKETNLFHLVSPQPFAYPVQSRDAPHLLIPSRRDEVMARIRDKPFLHIWNEILRRAVIFTWMGPPPQSLLAELFQRHGIDLGQAPVYTADQVQRLNDNYHASAIRTYELAERVELERTNTRLRVAQAQADVMAETIARLRVAQTQAQADEMAKEVARRRAAQAQADEMAEEVARLHGHLGILQDSASWRMTAPLRRLVAYLRARGYRVTGKSS